MVALIKPQPIRTEVAEPAAGALLQLVEADFRQPRRDALPENTHYADTGCDLHSSCLTCPLARCRYDEPGGARRLLSTNRDSEVLMLQRHGGLTIDGIARRVGISRRTVFRILARSRSAGGRS